MRKLVTDPDYAVRKLSEAESLRAPFESAWTEAAKHVLPRHYEGLLSIRGGPMASQGYGEKSTRVRAWDGTGRKMLPRFVAVLDRLLTPRGQRWHRLQTSDRSLNRSRRVKEFYAELSDVLFEQRYRPQARFISGISETYTSIGVFGNAALSIRPKMRSPASRPGLAYRAFPMKDVFWLTNADGDRDTLFLQRFLNARQAVEAYPGASMPEVVQTELSKQGGPSESRYFRFVEIVCVNTDLFDPQALDFRRNPWLMRPFLPEARAFIGEPGGFRSMPLILPRYFTEPGDIYGTSPAIASTPTMGAVSAIKRHMLKLSERRADPSWLTHASNIMIDATPNGVTAGALDAEGRPLVRPLETTAGDTRLAETVLADERADIEDSFFGKLFELLDETREMTAREIAERVGKEFALVAPTMGRMLEELIDPCVSREVDVLVDDPELSRKLPEVPPELEEAEGEYTVELTSPMARAERMEDVQGFIQAVEIALGFAERTQRPEYAERFDIDTAMPEIAEIMNVPLRWLKSDEEMEALREQQAQQQALETAVQAAPAIAGLQQAAR